jgi:hypothetical protein
VTAGSGDGRRSLVRLADLLAATGCADLEELSGLVDSDSEPDMWVDEIDGGVEIGSGTQATCLEFPFLLADFWAVVDEVEREEARWIESSADPLDDESQA